MKGLNEQINRMKFLMKINENKSVFDINRYFDTEELDENISESPSGVFNIKQLVSITSFSERVKYCNSTLKYLGQGSARRVYELPDGKNVLKLAKNQKGLAQNEAEHDLCQYAGAMLAEIEYEDVIDDNILFVIMEKAEKIKEADFKILTDVPFEDFTEVTRKSKRDWDLAEKLYNLTKQIGTEKSEDFYERMHEYVTSSGLDNFGDLRAITSYGKVMRDGTPTLVLVDYGFTNDVATNYYNM